MTSIWRADPSEEEESSGRRGSTIHPHPNITNHNSLFYSLVDLKYIYYYNMEALRYSLFAPTTATVFMVFGTFHAMKEMAKTRYAANDENGKTLLPHPYEPWNVRTTDNPKHTEACDKAYRAFKMFENVKEWTFMSLPLVWVFAIYGGDLPYATDAMMDGTILVSTGLYMLANAQYIEGYISAPEKRFKGFKLRRKVVEFWLLGCLVSIGYGGLVRYGLVGA
jgi:hypothetical protein